MATKEVLWRTGSVLLKGIKEMLHQWVLPKAGLLLHLPAATTLSSVSLAWTAIA